MIVRAAAADALVHVPARRRASSPPGAVVLAPARRCASR